MELSRIEQRRTDKAEEVERRLAEDESAVKQPCEKERESLELAGRVALESQKKMRSAGHSAVSSVERSPLAEIATAEALTPLPSLNLLANYSVAGSLALLVLSAALIS